MKKTLSLIVLLVVFGCVGLHAQDCPDGSWPDSKTGKCMKCPEGKWFHPDTRKCVVIGEDPTGAVDRELCRQMVNEGQGY